MAVQDSVPGGNCDGQEVDSYRQWRSRCRSGTVLAGEVLDIDGIRRRL
ncbi:MAG: hypothetical protein ACLUUO_15355 [Sellimonas intestinalis]